MGKFAAAPEIPRRYLHEEVADRLRALILAGELEPRARINELELTERFGISRTPLREAIKILATEGLLELLPNRGSRVASITLSEIDEMAEVIAGLEATAGDLAARLVTPAEIAAIEAKHRLMVEAWRAQNAPVYFQYNREIHEAIIAAARNATLQSLYASLSGRIQRARYSAHKTPEQWAKAVDDHVAMIALLKAGDAEALSRLMRDHVRSKKPVIAAAYGAATALASPPATAPATRAAAS
jgi:DNA-binding GntR family transcriptional regulator